MIAARMRELIHPVFLRIRMRAATNGKPVLAMHQRGQRFLDVSTRHDEQSAHLAQASAGPVRRGAGGGPVAAVEAGAAAQFGFADAERQEELAAGCIRPPRVFRHSPAAPEMDGVQGVIPFYLPGQAARTERGPLVPGGGTGPGAACWRLPGQAGFEELMRAVAGWNSVNRICISCFC